jgi:hypothetical protein
VFPVLHGGGLAWRQVLELLVVLACLQTASCGVLLFMLRYPWLGGCEQAACFRMSPEPVVRFLVIPTYVLHASAVK